MRMSMCEEVKLVGDTRDLPYIYKARIVQPGHRIHGDCARETRGPLREGAYARSYGNSAERTVQLDSWLHDYTFHRPPASLNLNTPASRAGLNRNNLLSLHS